MNVTETTEPMDFHYRLTNKGGGSVGLEVGDGFEASPAFGGGTEGVMQQIGLDMVRKGLQFLGHDAESAKMLSLLALKSGGDVEWSEADDEDEV